MSTEALKSVIKESRMKDGVFYLLKKDLNTTVLGDERRAVELLKEGWDMVGTFHNGTGYSYYRFATKSEINSLIAFVSEFIPIDNENINLIQVSFTEYFNDEYESDGLKACIEVFADETGCYFNEDQAANIRGFLVNILGKKQDSERFIRNVERQFIVNTLKEANYKYEFVGEDVKVYYNDDSGDFTAIRGCDDGRFGYFEIEGKVQNLMEWVAK